MGVAELAEGAMGDWSQRTVRKQTIREGDDILLPTLILHPTGGLAASLGSCHIIASRGQKPTVMEAAKCV